MSEKSAKSKFKKRRKMMFGEEIDSNNEQKTTKTTLLDEFDRDIFIDRAKLDLENSKQPRLYYKYSKPYLEAVREELEAKEKFARAKAQIAQDIRKNPENYDLKKVTEGSIQEVLLTSKEYKEAHSRYLDAVMAKNEMEEKMKVIYQRGHILTNLTRLLETGYYTATSMTPEEWEFK